MGIPTHVDVLLCGVAGQPRRTSANTQQQGCHGVADHARISDRYRPRGGSPPESERLRAAVEEVLALELDVVAELQRVIAAFVRHRDASRVSAPNVAEEAGSPDGQVLADVVLAEITVFELIRVRRRVAEILEPDAFRHADQVRRAMPAARARVEVDHPCGARDIGVVEAHAVEGLIVQEAAVGCVVEEPGLMVRQQRPAHPKERAVLRRWRVIDPPVPAILLEACGSGLEEVEGVGHGHALCVRGRDEPDHTPRDRIHLGRRHHVAPEGVADEAVSGRIRSSRERVVNLLQRAVAVAALGEVAVAFQLGRHGQVRRGRGGLPHGF